MPVKKAHVDFSIKGEAQQTEHEHVYINDAVPEIQNDYVIFKLVKNDRRGRLRIDGMDDVINPKTGKPERIRLLSGIDTIWFSEQQKMNLTPEFINQSRRSLVFDSRVCRIPTWDKTALEFAETCRHYIENPNRKTGSKCEFFKYDPEKQQKAALEKEMKELDMAMVAKDMNIVKAKKIASYLGIRFVDELGRPKSDSGIRQELMLRAKREPFKFEALIDSKEVDISYMVKAAILDAKIDLGKQPNSAYWAAGGFICKIPQARKPQEYLTEYAMGLDDANKQFLQRLQETTA